MTLPVLNPPIITLTTDFGLSDTYVGVMKGVILSIAPQARLVDLTHEVAPQGILEGSVRLEEAVDVFPAGTIHLVVIDPGVGSERAACVVETERALYVAPDNGVLTLALHRQPPVRIVQLGEAAMAYARQPLCATFHGRDLFAPIAAHLANGLQLDALGDVTEITDFENASSLVILRPPVPDPEHDAQGRPVLRLHILYADRFGNLITDLTSAIWETSRRSVGARQHPDSEVTVRAGDREWRGLARTFSDVAIGSALAYWGSDGRLEIAIRNGNAAQELGLRAGDSITLQA